MRTLRQSAPATVLRNGKVLAAGGFGNGSFLSSAELFDPSPGAWSFTGSMRDQRWVAAAVLLPDGKVLVAGGAPNIFTLTPVRKAGLYDQATGNRDPTGANSPQGGGAPQALLPTAQEKRAGGC